MARNGIQSGVFYYFKSYRRQRKEYFKDVYDNSKVSEG
jgi:hypothetical protein